MDDTRRSSWSWPDRYPAPPPAPPAEPIGIALHDLSAEKRARLWRWILANDAPFAAWLKSAEFTLMRQAFNATPVVTREYLDRAMAETKGATA